MKDKNSSGKEFQMVKKFLKAIAPVMIWLENSKLAMKPDKSTGLFKSYFRLIESNAIVLLFLVMISIVLFQHALIDYPRKDHNAYLAQKTFFDHPADWCQFSASYSRTRLLQKGDEYLFRPAHMLFLCVEDVFLEKKPILLGTISVVSASIATFILFLICSTFLNSRTGGLLASLCWLAFFPGIELILWRHISPYIFSLVFGFGGIYYFYSNTTHNTTTRNVIATALLLYAGLFHEMAVVALAIFVGLKILILAINRIRSNLNFGLNKVSYSIFPALAAIILFALLDIIDFKVNGHSVIGPQDTFLKDGFATLIWRSAYATVHFMGLSILTLTFPFSITLAFMEDSLMLIGLPENTYVILFCALIGVLVMSLAAYFLYKSKHSFQSPQPQLVAYSLCFLIAGFLALGVLRGGMRGLGYLQWANYYFSIFTWCWIIILSFLLKLTIDSSALWQKGSKNLIVLLSSLGAIVYISTNFYMTTHFTKTQYKPRAIQYWVSQGLFPSFKTTDSPQIPSNDIKESSDPIPKILSEPKI